MKNKISHTLFPVLISAILLISIMPFYHVKAEETSPSYIELQSMECLELYPYYNTIMKVIVSDTSRIVVIRTQSQQKIYAVSLINNTKYLTFNVDGCYLVNNNWYATYQSAQYQGTTYYWAQINYRSQLDVNSEIPQYTDTSLSNLGSYGELAYRLTYGDMSVDPEPEINYGSLKIGFSTSIAYSGGNSNAWRLNKDTIWFDQYDTLGNDLRGLNIELQAVPYSTEASTRQNLLGQKFNEFFYDTVRVGSLGFYSPGQNPIDFTWEYITNRFSPTWWSTYGENWSLTGWFLNEGWYKVGWAYRARVVDDELNTIIDWQWIYNATSVDAQDTENIINNTGYNPDLVNSINNINNINNTTNNNYYNNQTINYNSTEPTSSGSWIEEMIRGIFSTIGTLIEMIGGVFSELIKGLSDMIVELGVDVLGFFRDIFDSITGNNQQIDLTLPEFNLNQNDFGALNEFKKLTNGYVAIFINSGMWFVIVVPLVMMLLKVVIKWKS